MPKFSISPPEKKGTWSHELPPKQLFLASEGTYQIPAGGSSETVVRANSCYVDRLDENNNRFQCATKSGVNRNSSIFRVKNVHSNEWANLEILSAKYAGLTGIAVPWTVFCTGAERDNPALAADCQKRKDIETLGDKPNYFVASQRLKGYHDLSTFIDYIHDNQLDAFFPTGDAESDQKRAEFVGRYNELALLKTDPAPNTAENKIKKRDCMIACFGLMPQEIKDMMDEAFVVSAWLGNWDMFNWDLTNMGFTVLHKEDGSAAIFPAIIDFGNCLNAGFGGKHKDDSLDVANTAAKLYSENPTHPRHSDYDPSPIRPISRIEAAMFSAIPGLALASIPRREPFEALFLHNDEQVVKCLENRRDGNGELSKGFMRGLYRIASITDSAIDTVTNEWFHLGEAINYTSTDPSSHSTKEQMAGLMKQRKDYICNRFAPEIEQYEYISEALETKKEVFDSIFDLTGQEILPIPLQVSCKRGAASDGNLRYHDQTRSPTALVQRQLSLPDTSETLATQIPPEDFVDKVRKRSNSAPPRFSDAHESARCGRV